jgi:phosphodiesterase/alkaline phosphatase D-like protein
MMRLRFAHGELGRSVALGAVTDRSVRVWLREPSGAAQMAVLMVDGEAQAEAILQPAAAHDYVAAAELALPHARPHAPFAVHVGGDVRRGALAPAPGERSAFAFGFGSCNQPFTRGADGALVARDDAGIYPAAADLMRARGGRFLLLIGDQLYDAAAGVDRLWKALARHEPPADDTTLLALYRQLYRGYFAEPGYRALLDGWPTRCIWDDHDILDAWGSLLHPDPFTLRRWPAARRAYREYQHLRNPGASVEDEPPYHYHFWYGDAGFFVLDLRGERDYERGVLDVPRQRRALEVFLMEASAAGVATLFVVSTIPPVHFSPALLRGLEDHENKWGNGARDRWSARPFRVQRSALTERLLTWQTARPGRQVFLLSGDVHAGAAFMLRRRSGPGVLHQWTSSALTTPYSPVQLVANVVGTTLAARGEWRYRLERRALVLAHNFGLVELTPLPGGGHQVTMTLHAYHGRHGRLEAAARVVERPGE